MFKLIENLDNYFILNEEGEEAIIGTYITVKVLDTKNKHPFSPYRPPTDREYPVFFLISGAVENSKMKSKFTKNGLPVMPLNNKKMPETAEEFRIKLDEFVETTF